MDLSKFQEAFHNMNYDQMDKLKVKSAFFIPSIRLFKVI